MFQLSIKQLLKLETPMDLLVKHNALKNPFSERIFKEIDFFFFETETHLIRLRLNNNNTNACFNWIDLVAVDLIFFGE